MVEKLHKALPVTNDSHVKAKHYREVTEDIKACLQDEDDWCAAMATVSSVLHEAFAYFHWTGFYRTVGVQEPTAASSSTLYQQGSPTQEPPCSRSQQQQPPLQLVVGPYQGSLGCLRIPYDQGVCGAAARTRTTQLVPDVHAFPGHIACASSTCSEVVVPILTPQGRQCAAVLDVDSDLPAVFDVTDQQELEELCAWLGQKYFAGR